MKAIRILLNLLLLAGVIVVGYNLYKTVEEPIVFEQKRAVRDDAAIAKLQKIRQAQIIFKNKYGVYANSFDTLITVIKNEHLEVIKQIGDPNDSTQVSKTVVTKIAIIDSLFKGDAKAVEDLPLVPFTNNEKFGIVAQMIKKNDVEVPAFEVKTPYTSLYNGLIKKYYLNKVGKSMKVGSLEEGTTTGNWEK